MEQQGRILLKKDVVLLSEVDLCEALNIKADTLRRLRLEKDFPFARLTVRDRVYFIEDVLIWLGEQKA